MNIAVFEKPFIYYKQRHEFGLFFGHSKQSFIIMHSQAFSKPVYVHHPFANVFKVMIKLLKYLET